MSNPGMSQKEYLKKYLSKSDDKQKKKKKKQKHKGLCIIDDDIMSSSTPLEGEIGDELDLYELAEHAPQVAGFVDDRPQELQSAEQFANRLKWRAVKDSIIKLEPPSPSGDASNTALYEDSMDMSPPRIRPGSGMGTRSPENDCDLSPPRKVTKNKPGSGVDRSPSSSRKRVRGETSRHEKQRGDSMDLSPPRKGSKPSTSATRDSMDLSPPRKGSKPSTSATRDSMDLSPPRKGSKPSTSFGSHGRSRSPTFRRRFSHYTSSYDKSHHHRRSQNRSPSPSYQPRDRHSRGHSGKHYRDKNRSDKRSISSHTSWRDEHGTASPRSRSNTTMDHSLERRDQEESRRASQDYQRGTDGSQSRDEKYSSKSSHKIHKETGLLEGDHKNDPDSHRSKARSTLDGKRAGLQDARTLKQELEAKRKREHEHFQQMDDVVSGRGAATVVRDKKTGRKRDRVLEEKKRLEEEAGNQKRNEAFKQLSKGVVQSEAQERRFAEFLHEASKPMARYANDEDLETLLKNREREGDPMLELLRGKDHDKDVSKPRYRGPAGPPNRYNIPPGHRWDGKDRSTGFEIKLFESKSAKKADEDEAYSWSVADM